LLAVRPLFLSLSALNGQIGKELTPLLLGAGGQESVWTTMEQEFPQECALELPCEIQYDGGG